MESVNKRNAELDTTSDTNASILEISTNIQDDTLNYQTADEENSSKYYSMITDSTLEASSADVTLESKSVVDDSFMNESKLVKSLSSSQNNSVDKLHIHEKIDAAKILSGGVDIFEDNENSSDEQGLVIDYDAQAGEASENNTKTDDNLKKVTTEEGTKECDKSVECTETKEAGNTNNDVSAKKDNNEEQPIKSSGEGLLLRTSEEEPGISDDVSGEGDAEKTDNYSALLQSNLPEGSSEVTLLIDDKNVDAIDIGEGVFIYKNDDGELTAIQITMNEDGTTNFKCLHVGKNEDGNLEVYEEQVSQVPVTTEELESMRSQELSKQANALQTLSAAEPTVSKQSKEESPEVINQKTIKTDVVDKEEKYESPCKDTLNAEKGKGNVKPAEVSKPAVEDVTTSINDSDTTPILEDKLVPEENTKSLSGTMDVSVAEEISKPVADIVSQSKQNTEEVVDNVIKPIAEDIVMSIEESAVASVDSKSPANDSIKPVTEIIKESYAEDTSKAAVEEVSKPDEEEIMKLEYDASVESPSAPEVVEQNEITSFATLIPIDDDMKPSMEPEELNQEKTSEAQMEAPSATPDNKESCAPSIVEETLKEGDVECVSGPEAETLVIDSDPKNLVPVEDVINNVSVVNELHTNPIESSRNIDTEVTTSQSPVNVCGVVTKISDPVLPSEITSDSQDSTSNMLSVINNEESSNTMESEVSTCSSINPPDCIMSDQLSDTLCTKLNDNKKPLNFEMSNLELKNDNTQSTTLSEDISQESVTKSISDGDNSNGSNLQLPIIEDSSMSQDSITEEVEARKEPESVSAVTNKDESNNESEIVKTNDINNHENIDASLESQASVESDDEDDYIVGEPVTGDSEAEWSKVEEKPLKESTSDIVPKESAIETAVEEVAIVEEVVDVAAVNLSDNNNDVSKSKVAEKENVDESVKNSEVIIKEIDFDKFVRRNSVQMFEECAPLEYEDVTETIKTKSVPVLELEYKTSVTELSTNNVQITTCKVSEAKGAEVVQPTSPVVSKSSRTLDESITFLATVAERTPSPKKNLSSFKPNYSPVENNKYMMKSPYSSFTNQSPKPYAPSSAILQSPTDGLRKQDSTNVKPRTYSPLHKPTSPATPPLASKSEKSPLSFTLLSEKTSPTQSPTSQVPLQSSVAVKHLETVSPDTKSSTVVTQVENSTQDTDVSKIEVDVSETQKIKNRQPRKQVFTPITSTNMEIIFPNLFNNAQGYKKESDAKALKLKKEQDIKFRQLSKKEQSRRNEKTNQPPVKPAAKAVSPIKPLDKSMAKDSVFLSSPVKGFDKSILKSPLETMSPVRIPEKPVIIKDYGFERINQDVTQPLNPIKVPIEAFNKDVPHSLSFNNTERILVNELPKVSSPVKTNDKSREQFYKQTLEQSPVARKESPVKSTISGMSPTKEFERKPYNIDLPTANVEKNAAFSNKYSNHHGGDNSRHRDYTSPRTYSRVPNKSVVQSVYNLSAESSKQSSIDPLPKLTEVIERKSPFTTDISPKQNTAGSPKEQHVKSGSPKELPVKTGSPKGQLTPTKKIHPNLKDVSTPVLNNETETKTVKGVLGKIKSNTHEDGQRSPTSKETKSVEAVVTKRTNKDLGHSTHNNEEKMSPVNKNTVEKSSSPVISSPNESQSLSGKSSTLKTPKKPQNKPENVDSAKMEDKPQNNTPVTESAKRKRGRPKKNVTDSPATPKPKESSQSTKPKEPSQSPKHKESSQSPVRKVENSVKGKSTPKDSPKIEEKSRASSISPFGKIDENIKCPICFKTFRTHNVLIKHVKHCNGTIDVETIKTPKRRKLTDAKLDESMESEKTVDDVDTEENKSKPSKKDLITDESSEKASDQSNVKSLEKKHVPVSVESPNKNQVTTAAVAKEEKLESPVDNSKTESKVNNLDTAQTTDSNVKVNVKNKDDTVETIVLDDSLVELDGEKKSVKDFSKVNAGESSDSSKYVAKKHRAPGRPPKDKNIESNKQAAAAPSPMSRLAKILNKNPPDNSPIACTVCGKTFRQLAHMVYHRASKHNVEETDVLPAESAKSSNDEVKSKSDVTEPVAETDAILKCEICHKGFRKLHHLVEHREMHANAETKSRRTSVASVKSEPEAGFRCDTCDKSFRKLHHLVEHRELHLAEVAEIVDSPAAVTPSKVNEPKPVEDATCPGCGKSFRKRHHMVEHRDVHCSPSKKGKSEDGSSVDTNIRLSTASSTSDEGNSCGICGKSYRKLHHMVEHRESHAEVREEKAKNKSYSGPEHLNTKDIIHECSRCYMVFPNENSLNKHIDICSRKRLVKKSFNFNTQDKTDAANVDQPANKVEENTVVTVLDDDDTVNIKECDNDIVIVEPAEPVTVPVPQLITDAAPVNKDDDVPESNRSSEPAPSKESLAKSQKSEKKPVAAKDTTAKPQNTRKSTLTKETISSRSRKSTILKHKNSLSDDASVVSKSSSVRKSSISSESVSSRISMKRKSSSSVECLPVKRPNTKDAPVSKPTTLRKSLDSVSKKITKVPNRRSLQTERSNNDDEESSVKYKLNESDESNVKYKINPEFSKSIKRLSQSSSDSKPAVKNVPMKAKARRSESALSGLRIPKEKTLQTIMEESVRYSFPKSSPKPKTVEPEKVAPEAQPVKKQTTAKAAPVAGKRVVVTKKTNIVVANKRKSLGGRKSIDTKKLPGVVKKLQLRCCSQVFHSQADLAAHRKTHKDAQKVHKCDCGKVFDTEGLLKRHMDIEHTPPKSYKCGVCGASVRTATQYAKHKKDHENEQKQTAASKKSTESKQQAKSAKTSQKTEVPKTVKSQPGKSKSPVTETRKGVKRKVAHGGVPLSDKMKKAMAGAKF